MLPGRVPNPCFLVSFGLRPSSIELLSFTQMPFVTTTEAGVPIQGPTATLIYDDWYPALRTDTLRKGKLATAMLLDIPLVLGRRSDGRVFAMRDSCPHRGIPLSYGWFDGNRVTCRYHGWEFEPCSGQCELIPSLSSHDRLDATRIYATAFPCEERDGHAWVYIPGAGSRAKGEAAERGRCRSWPSLVRASAPRISPPTCPATWITGSSG